MQKVLIISDWENELTQFSVIFFSPQIDWYKQGCFLETVYKQSNARLQNPQGTTKEDRVQYRHTEIQNFIEM